MSVCVSVCWEADVKVCLGSRWFYGMKLFKKK